MNNRAKFSLILGTILAASLGLVWLSATSGARGTASKAAWGTRKASEISRAAVEARWGKLPLRFEASIDQMSEGQAGEGAQFIARGPGYGVLLGGAEATLVLDRAPKEALPGHSLPEWATAIDRLRAAQRQSVERAVVTMEFSGANRAATAEALEKLETETNYFIGNDPSKWRRKVANYRRVRYRGVYPGVDLDYYGKDGRLEYDLKVAAGQSPDVIGMRFTGTERMRVDRDGALVLGVKGSEIRQLRPKAYQMVAGVERPVEARYTLSGNEVRFELGAYDRSRELVIDPAIGYSTYFGGNMGDTGNAIAVDGSGNVYLTGNTSSTNLPTTGHAFPPFQAALSSGGSDAYVVKLNAGATAVVFSTYIGGNTFDEGDAIAVDASGVYVGGITASTNFPGTTGFAQPAKAFVAGQANGWLAKLDPNGQNLLYATYLGGGGTDAVNALTVDGSGVVYATGATFSGTGGNLPSFPTTAGVFQTKFGGTTGGAGGTGDAFLTKLSADGKTFVYSTYLGGVADEQGNAIVIDGSGNAFVGGETNAQTSTAAFPSPPSAGVIQPGPPAKTAGGSSGWVAEVNAGATALTYFTYLGGNGDDHIQGMTRDGSGNLYVTGRTASTNYPVMPKPGAAQTAYGGGAFDAFITKINGTGTAIAYSTYLGGSGDDEGADIRVDANGFAYVVGLTTGGFPVTASATQGAIAGPMNAFIAKVRPTGTQVVFASYHGGNGTDFAKKMVIDASNPPNVYFTGSTTSTTFPTTAGVAQTANGGGQDAFAVKIDASVPVSDLLPTMLAFGNQSQGTTSAAQAVTYTNNGNAPLTINSIAVAGEYTQTNNCGMGAGNTFPSMLAAGASCTINVTFAPVVGPAGPDNGTLTATDNAAGSPHTVALTGTFVASTAMGTLTPAMLAFGNQLVGTTSASQAVTYKNAGNAPLTINSIRVTTDYTETDNCGASPGNTFPNALAAGASCTINVSFGPTTLPGGARNGTLTATDNGTSSPEIATLTGTSQAPSAIIAPNPVVFGNQNVGTSSAPMTATLTNNGNSTLNISSITLFPVGASDFSQTNNCGATLAPAAMCTFNVTFSPIGGSAAGQPRFGSIDITDDAQPFSSGQTTSTQILNLQGTGVTPAGGSFTLFAGSPSVTIHPGQTATYAILVIPAGGFNQAVALSCAGAPTLATCIVQPNPVTPNGFNSSQATVIVTTKGRGTLPPRPFGPRGTPPWTMWLLAAMMAALAAGMMMAPIRARIRYAAPMALVALIVGLTVFASACGSSGSAGTPTGTSVLTITGTGGGQTQMINLTLNVVP